MANQIVGFAMVHNNQIAFFIFHKPEISNDAYDSFRWLLKQ